MCKMDLKDAYFSVPLHPGSRKYVRFRWKGALYEFLCLAFGLGPSPRIFTKLIKVPISILRKLGVCLVIYLDDLLIMASSKEELLWARDTTMYLFHHLGLTINMKKSVLEPSQIMEFLGVLVNSRDLTFSLPEKKIKKLISKCQEALNRTRISTGTLFSARHPESHSTCRVPSSSADLSISLTNEHRSSSQKTPLRFGDFHVSGGKIGVLWIENLRILEGNPIHLPPPELTICSDAARTGGWGAVCHLGSTGGQWNAEERLLNITIKTFTKNWKPSSIHMEIDNTSALSYFLKTGRRDEKLGHVGGLQENMEIPLGASDHDYWRMDPIPSEHNSRLQLTPEQQPSPEQQQSTTSVPQPEKIVREPITFLNTAV